MGNKQRTIFVTGTDTNVGKTFISTWICYHMSADYWKPIQTGERDAEKIQEFSPQSTIHPECYYFLNSVSPHLAAEQEKRSIDLKKIEIPVTSNPLVIEGAGGVFVPINRSTLMIDLIKTFNVPVLIVSRNALGTINHTCLTVEALKKRDIPILGIILNGDSDLPNKEAIEFYSGVSVLASLPFIHQVSKNTLSQFALPNSINGAFK